MDHRDCTCEVDEKTIEPHPCPFRGEIGNDWESLCKCCAACQYQCGMDV